MSPLVVLSSLLLLRLYTVTSTLNCSWYNTINQHQRILCRTDLTIDATVDCGWCEATFNNITYRNECISIEIYCQNRTQCHTFDSLYEKPCEAGQSGRTYIALFVIGITLILVGYNMETIKDCLVQHFSPSWVNCILICICLTVIYIITVSIWYAADSSNVITDDILMLSMIIAGFIPIELVMLIVALRQFIEWVKKVNDIVKKPVHKYVLMIVIIIIYVSIVGVFALPVYFLFTGFEVLQAVTCLSVLFLWLDLKELAFHVQTEESSALWDECDEFCERMDACCEKNNSINNDNHQIAINYGNIEEEHKYDDADHEDVEEAEEHHIQLLVGELCCFSLSVSTFIVLSFVSEHLEPCFMNLATMVTVAAHVALWVKHKKPPFYCKLIMIMIVVVMIACTSYSCTCNENCIWAHIAVIVLVCLWSLIVASNKLCRRKKNRNNVRL